MELDYPKIWSAMMEEFALGDWSIHGGNHWKNVERNGLQIAATSGADVTVVRLFAVLHDSQRKNESYDPQHGPRAAKVARQLHGELFTIDAAQLDLLCEACAFHTSGDISADTTIGTCWDADRLDLPRVGIRPHPSKMSTEAGRKLAAKCR